MSTAVQRAFQGILDNLQSVPEEQRPAVLQLTCNLVAKGVLRPGVFVDPATLPKFVNGSHPSAHDIAGYLARREVGDTVDPKEVTEHFGGNPRSPADNRWTRQQLAAVGVEHTKPTKGQWTLLQLPKPEDFGLDGGEA